MKIRWTENALLELDGAHAFYAEVDRKLAARVFRTIQISVRHLARFPSAGRPGACPCTREVVVRNLPFLVIYRVLAKEVQVLRVLHTAQDWPGLM